MPLQQRQDRSVRSDRRRERGFEHIACCFRSTQGMRTPFCTSDAMQSPAEILASRGTELLLAGVLRGSSLPGRCFLGNA